MSKTLSTNIGLDAVYLPDLDVIQGIVHKPDGPSVILTSDNKEIIAACINCHNPRCMTLHRTEIQCSTFSGMAHDMMLDICPVNAIDRISNRISIDERKCFGCGLCVSRCPVGALYINNDNAVINTSNELPRKKLQPTEESINKQKEAITKLLDVMHTGSMVMEDENTMDRMYQRIKSLSQKQQNLFARNILICLSNNATVSRQGDVYLRMDGYYENVDKHGVVEVETGLDMLEVSRAILDDIAVLHSRHNIPKEENAALAICLNLANRRTDYWQEVKDIRDVTGIEIYTVTFAILLIFMWNNVTVKDFSDFYIDVENSSLRSEAEKLLGRRIRISIGHEGMIENSK